jgi:hypothetical protein
MVDNAAADLGRRGGKARAAGMTKEERSEAARQAVTARWDRVRAKAKTKKKGTKRG